MVPSERENDMNDETLISSLLMDLSHLAAEVARDNVPRVLDAANLTAECLQNGGKVMACGNGGSAAQADHFVAELVGRLEHDRPGLPAIALTTAPAVITALSNDFGYEQVFARQVEAMGVAGDLLVALSTSGASPNVLAAVKVASERSIRTLALTGRAPETSLESCDVCIKVPSENTQRIQEIHSVILHAICEVAERQLLVSRGQAGR